MSENKQIIRAKLTRGGIFVTVPAFRYDSGHLLQLIGFNLPEKYDVHFAHSVEGETNIIVPDCSGDMLEIPDEVFTEAQNILCWICYRSETEFFTLYEINIPVSPRPPIPNP